MAIEIEEIKKVKLSDGDVLIVQVDHPALMNNQRDAIADRFNGIFPSNKVIVLDQGFSIGVLSKQ